MKHKSPLRDFSRGARDGIPIALGYGSVAFSIGILAVASGIAPWVAVLISAVNLTSAGEVAGIAILAAGGSPAEMALTQLVINIRYALMSLTLTQKMSPDFSTGHRLLAGFGITDEIFAVAASRSDEIAPGYMYGLILLPLIGWTAGTAVGACAGELLPAMLKSALGIAIYGMFIAVVLPPARANRAVAAAALIAAGLSCAICYLPLFSFLSGGFSVIVCAVIAAAIAAFIRPVKEAVE